MLVRRCCAVAVAFPLVLCSAALAQPTRDNPMGMRLPYALDTGPLKAGGGAGAEQVVFSREVTVPGALWLRLHFAEAGLAPGAAIVVRAAADGETQRLDAEGLEMWSNSTAYFNGDTVLLEVVAPRGAAGECRVVIREIETEFGVGVPGGLRGDPGECGICGTDDRTPSSQAWAARLMPVGCTASIICENSTFVTAGHCISGTVVQFNVPASQSNCNTVNPPVADQFPVITSTRRWSNAGVGADWGVFRTGVNNLNETPFERYGQVRPIAPNPPVNGTVINIFAYGADTNCVRNQTQQRSIGTINQVAPDFYGFNADVRGGSSGSAILVANQIVGVVTHCSGGGCSNSGTRVDLQPFRDAINEISNCDVSHTLQVRATRLDTAAPVAVTISINPADNSGNSSGTTPLDRSYLEGVNVTLAAPSEAAGLCFRRWEIDGVDQGPSTVLAMTVTAPATVTARYAGCCLADWDGSGAVNSTDISAFLTAWLDSLNNQDLNADFDGSGAVNSSDISAFLTQWLTDVSTGC
jgi:V8-like Glu-specific endopeptidase